MARSRTHDPAQTPPSPEGPGTASTGSCPGRLVIHQSTTGGRLPLTSIRFELVTGADGQDDKLFPYRLAAEAIVRREDVVRMLRWAAYDECFVDEILALLRRWYVRSACTPRAVVCDNSFFAVRASRYDALRERAADPTCETEGEQ
ncbi:MAG: hypothetical protein FJZ01_26215 [Candidatus Sericytochromatia bacterium]|nr:hypothetical protein [Candidatus Tanganyikabacteria bacterium]